MNSFGVHHWYQSQRFSESEANSISPTILSEALRSEIKFQREFAGHLSEVKQNLEKVLRRLDRGGSKLDQPPRSEKESRSDHQGQQTQLHRFGLEPPSSGKKGRDQRLGVRSRLWESGAKKKKLTRQAWVINKLDQPLGSGGGSKICSEKGRSDSFLSPAETENKARQRPRPRDQRPPSAKKYPQNSVAREKSPLRSNPNCTGAGLNATSSAAMQGAAAWGRPKHWCRETRDSRKRATRSRLRYNDARSVGRRTEAGLRRKKIATVKTKPKKTGMSGIQEPHLRVGTGGGSGVGLEPPGEAEANQWEIRVRTKKRRDNSAALYFLKLLGSEMQRRRELWSGNGGARRRGLYLELRLAAAPLRPRTWSLERPMGCKKDPDGDAGRARRLRNRDNGTDSRRLVWLLLRLRFQDAPRVLLKMG